MSSILTTILQMEKLTDEEQHGLRQFISFGRNVTLPKGCNLYQTLGQGQWLVHVDSGLLRQYVVDDHGNEKIVHLFWEQHIFDNCNTSAGNANMQFTVSALEDTHLTVFRIEDITDVSMQYPVFMRIATTINNQLVQNHNEHTTLLMTYSPDERYRYLMANRPGLLRRLSVTHLAQYLDISRETLSRIRSRMLEGSVL